MAFRWRSNLRELLFGAAPTGLDPDEDQVATDLEQSYYNYRLVRHQARGDLVANPGYLWSSNAYWKSRGGLAEHLLREADALDGVAYTDVLIVLSEPDWKKTLARVVTPWDESVRELLADKYETLLSRNRLIPLHPQRGFQLRVLRDGGLELGGARFQLNEGEFLTGLMPHLYHGPVASSTLLAEIFLRLPAWEGELRKVGALYSDQLAFTIGNHGLDSFQDPQIAEPALYHLHHFPDTPRLEHRLNLDLEDRYALGAPTVGPDGEEIQPVIRLSDEAVCLEIVLVRPAPLEPLPVPFPEAPAPPEPPASSGLPELTDLPVVESEAGAGLEALSGDALPVTVEEDEKTAVGSTTIIARPGTALPGEMPTGARLEPGAIPGLGARTVIPELADEGALRLSERGVLLQKIHFPQAMVGYHVNLGPTGHIGLTVREPFARLRVELDRVWLDALLPGTSVDGERLEPGQARDISQGVHRIAFASIQFDFRELRQESISGWPFLAELRRPPVTRLLSPGATWRIGRNRKKCAVALPDHADQSNILWHPALGEDGSVPGASGAIARDRIYTDSIMVAGEHAEISLEGSAPVLRNISGRCQVFVRRSPDGILSLVPGREGQGGTATLRSGDEILLGNSLFRVSFQDAYPFDPRSTTLQLKPLADGGRSGSSMRYPADPEAVTVKQVPAQSSSPDREPSPKPLPPAPAFSSPLPAASAPASPPPAGTPVARDEGAWAVEIRRPGRLVLLGWAIAGQVTAGNHTGADLVLPENRIDRGQIFVAQSYFTAFVRGARARITRIPGPDVLFQEDGRVVETSESLEDLRILIARRDPHGEIDFTLTLSFPADAPLLPRAKARLLAVGLDDHSRGLFTYGIPAGEPRLLQLGDLRVKARWTAEGLRIEDYLETYRLPDGTCRELFVRPPAGGPRRWPGEGGEVAGGSPRELDPYRTPPEDGRPLVLPSGSLLVAGHLVFRVEA